MTCIFSKWMLHHSRLVVDVGRGHSQAHLFRVGSTRVCVSSISSWHGLHHRSHNSTQVTPRRLSLRQARSHVCWQRLHHHRGLLLAVQSGALEPLRSSYLEHLLKSGVALQKLQHLPEAAFWDVAAFQRLTESKECWASIFALSYRWLTGEHPDPDNFHLSKVVAFLKVHKAWAEEVGDCAVFWDFGSLFQPERTQDQKVLFCEALRASNVWYGSVHTSVLIQSHLPPGFTETPYTQSVWCFVEATISSLIKMSVTRYDTGALELDSAGNLVIDKHCVNVMSCCMGRRCVPLRPDVVRHLLHTEKKFTTDADKAVAADLYASFFNDVAGSCTKLNFGGLRWTDQEIRELAGCLRLFEKLEELILFDNKISDEGAVALAGALKDLKHLKLVDSGG